MSSLSLTDYCTSIDDLSVMIYPINKDAIYDLENKYIDLKWDIYIDANGGGIKSLSPIIKCQKLFLELTDWSDDDSEVIEVEVDIDEVKTEFESELTDYFAYRPNRLSFNLKQVKGKWVAEDVVVTF